MPRAYDPELSDMTSSDHVEDDVESEDDPISSEPEEEEEEDEGPPPPPKLRIKLKLPTVSSNSTPTPTPQDEMDVESEDDDDDDNDDGDDMDDSASNTPATSRPLTSRQAVLASGGDSNLISLPSLESGPSRKKKHLTETELALRREETARKRKNLTEKRLEDEKMETINRLLKKQTRPRNKKGGTAASTPVEPSAGTKPRKAKSASAEADAEAEEGEEEAVMEEELVEPPLPPSMYRWISTSKPVEGASEGDKTMRMTFSVPLIAMPINIEEGEKTERAVLPQRPTCAYPGCGQDSKYRVVRSGERACGMEHLKCLENPSSMTT